MGCSGVSWVAWPCAHLQRWFSVVFLSLSCCLSECFHCCQCCPIKMFGVIVPGVCTVAAGRLANMASQFGVTGAATPLEDLSKGVRSMANMLGAQVSDSPEDHVGRPAQMSCHPYEIPFPSKKHHMIPCFKVSPVVVKPLRACHSANTSVKHSAGSCSTDSGLFLSYYRVQRVLHQTPYSLLQMR